MKDVTKQRCEYVPQNCQIIMMHTENQWLSSVLLRPRLHDITAVKPVEQPVECLFTRFSRLFNRLFNRLNNRLNRVNVFLIFTKLLI